MTMFLTKAGTMQQSDSFNLRHAWKDLQREHVAVVVMLTSAVVITLVEYFFLAESLRELLPGVVQDYAPGVWYGAWSNAPSGTTAAWWGALVPWLWWVAGMLVLWVAVPIVVTRCLGLRVRELGLSTRGLASKLWIYAAMYLLVLVAVWWASTQKGFSSAYPMLKPWYNETWCWLVLLSWWALYAVQFFIVEFFFRGWMLFTLEKRMGMAAVAVMLVPYCMIHYHKPALEALAAIVAGLVLGWLALKTRSIWGGWLLHVAAAISMDIAALSQSQWGFPARFWP